MASIELRPIRPSDVSSIVRLHKQVFPREYLRHTIFYSPRVDKYLVALVSHPDLQQDHQLVGAWKGKRLVGYAHYRILENSFHLNQLVVHPAYQGRGIGRCLVEEWKKRAEDLGQYMLSLDVSEKNGRACDWYCTMGFEPVSRTYIYQCKATKFKTQLAEKTKADDKICVLKWEETAAWYRAFRIANIQLKYQNHIWKIGWIHKALFLKEELPKALVPILLHLTQGAKWLFLLCSGPLQNFSGIWSLTDILIRMERRL